MQELSTCIIEIAMTITKPEKLLINKNATDKKVLSSFSAINLNCSRQKLKLINNIKIAFFTLSSQNPYAQYSKWLRSVKLAAKIVNNPPYC